jgi:hypothetical protein
MRFTIIVFLFLGCQNSEKKSNEELLKFLELTKIHNSKEIHTESYNILNALANKDSNLIEIIERTNKNLTQTLDDVKMWHNCFKTHTDTIYQEYFEFFYSASFCHYKNLAKIYKVKDSVYFLEMKLIEHNDDYSMDMKCTYLFNKKIQLSEAEWQEFKGTIQKADFWSLKQDNYSSGYDGSTLDVIGIIKKNNDKKSIHSVHRWAPYKYSIFDSYKFILEKSKMDKGCMYYSNINNKKYTNIKYGSDLISTEK